MIDFVSTTDDRLQRFLERARGQVGATGLVHGESFSQMAAELCDGMRRAAASVSGPETRLRLAQRAGRRSDL